MPAVALRLRVYTQELFDHVRHFQETQRVEFKSFQHLLSDVAGAV